MTLWSDDSEEVGATTTSCPDNEWFLPGVHDAPPAQSRPDYAEAGARDPASSTATPSRDSPVPDTNHDVAVLTIDVPSIVIVVMNDHLEFHSYLELAVEVDSEKQVEEFIDEALWTERLRKIHDHVIEHHAHGGILIAPPRSLPRVLCEMVLIGVVWA